MRLLANAGYAEMVKKVTCWANLLACSPACGDTSLIVYCVLYNERMGSIVVWHQMVSGRARIAPAYKQYPINKCFISEYTAYFTDIEA